MSSTYKTNYFEKSFRGTVWHTIKLLKYQEQEATVEAAANLTLALLCMYGICRYVCLNV